MARSRHTATVLNNGKVLVLGGITPGPYGEYYNYSDLATAELYDPATGTWSAAGSMSSVRRGHTATLLNNGTVLVVGGARPTGGRTDEYLATAELYDPATDTWRATGSMASARQGHAVTLLSNGTVLVVGGFDERGTLATAELYDPATGTWSRTGSMTESINSPQVTRLNNGTVLVVGFDTSTEVYNPAKGLWKETGALAMERYGFTLMRLSDGNVLVAGGDNGLNYANYRPDEELFNTAKGVWTWTGSMSAHRQFHTAATLGTGKVLVTGGYDRDDYSRKVYSSTTELYDPKTGGWSAGCAPSTVREGHTATPLSNGQVLVVGGEKYGDLLDTAEVYAP